MLFFIYFIIHFKLYFIINIILFFFKQHDDHIIQHSSFVLKESIVGWISTDFPYSSKISYQHTVTVENLSKEKINQL